MRTSVRPDIGLHLMAKNNLTKQNYRSKKRSCPMCKPNKMHWDDSRTFQTKRESYKHADQLSEI
jgi:hypothetical protein